MMMTMTMEKKRKGKENKTGRESSNNKIHVWIPSHIHHVTIQPYNPYHNPYNTYVHQGI